jgi:exodeoxyribonuclease VII small subunit
LSNKRSNSADDSAPLSFEQAMEQLEAIVERIERGEIGLEDSVKQYEQGVALISRCKEILTAAEQKVDELTQKAGTPKG